MTAPCGIIFPGRCPQNSEPDHVQERHLEEGLTYGRCAKACRAHSLNGLPPDLCHDGALPSQVLVAQAEEVVDDERCGGGETQASLSCPSEAVCVTETHFTSDRHFSE